MELSNLRPAEGSKHSDNFRRGRGHGSGNGKTAGKGHKGQLARSGHKKPGFEGGQMPLYRRLPKTFLIVSKMVQMLPLKLYWRAVQFPKPETVLKFLETVS